MFPIEPGRDYAVITGDVIDSSGLTAPQRKELPGLIHRVSDELQAWYGPERLTPISIFGGDSWQTLLARPSDALRVALFVRASLLASELNVDTRLAIGVGGVDFVPESGIEEADGEAFRLSGRLLEEESKAVGGLRFAEAGQRTDATWQLALRLGDALVRSCWTEKRAQAMTGALRGWTLQRTADLWTPAISRQTVDRHLIEGCWPDVAALLDFYENREIEMSAL